tara:strand:- start:60 stop:1106 length:1047 start_codon:yes stop_codon:yes gene_type:complete
MSPFKSSAGRQLGKLIEGFKTSTIGKAFGSNEADLEYEIQITGTGNYSVLSRDGNYKFYVFNNPGTFTITSLNQPLKSRVAVIGGGGSGAGYNAAYFAGNNGNPSTAFGFTAYGGGAGAMYPGNAGQPGGSGGGGSVSGGGGDGNKQTGTTTVAADLPQGFPGGPGDSTYGAGGGGGAGQAGTAANVERSGAGGDGVILEMDKTGDGATGSLIPESLGTPGPIDGRWFGGGGGGGGGSTANAASDIEGGAGGGGKGAGPTSAQPETAGQANTGGGGGGWEDGGGGGAAGGGGAGGVVQRSKTFTPSDQNTTYPISIGAGGAAGHQSATNAGGSGVVLIRFARFRILNT